MQHLKNGEAVGEVQRVHRVDHNLAAEVHRSGVRDRLLRGIAEHGQHEQLAVRGGLGERAGFDAGSIGRTATRVARASQRGACRSSRGGRDWRTLPPGAAQPLRAHEERVPAMAPQSTTESAASSARSRLV